MAETETITTESARATAFATLVSIAEDSGQYDADTRIRAASELLAATWQPKESSDG